MEESEPSPASPAAFEPLGYSGFKGAGEEGPLLLAARELADLPARERLQADLLEAAMCESAPTISAIAAK